MTKVGTLWFMMAVFVLNIVFSKVDQLTTFSPLLGKTARLPSPLPTPRSRGGFVRDTYESVRDRFLQDNQSGDSSLDDWIVGDEDVSEEENASGSEDSPSSDDPVEVLGKVQGQLFWYY